MPIRIEDPFRDPTENLSEGVNPFVKLLKDGAADGSLPILYGDQLKPLKGQWLSHFAGGPQPKSKLVLEIGSHKGDVLSRMAFNHPDTGFVGIDITFKRVVHLAQKAATSQLDNIVSVLCNAKALPLLFAQGELDGVIIFFPDPWARKKRQQKNRLLNPEFLQILRHVIKPGGFFWFKTDHQEYFEQVKSNADESFQGPFAASGLTSETYTSHFEKHFQDQGLPTYQSCWMN